MRLLKRLIFLMLLILNLNVYANTCSYEEQNILNNDFTHIKIIYEILNDNKINILIYNVTENLYLSYFNPETKVEETIFYLDTNNGKYLIEKSAEFLEEYEFRVRSNLDNCYGKILTTKNIIKPKYNKFYELDICKNQKLVNHSYCQKFITKEIDKTKNEVVRTLEDFINAKVDVVTTKKQEIKNDKVKIILICSLSGIVLIIGVGIIIFVKKKRGEL